MAIYCISNLSAYDSKVVCKVSNTIKHRISLNSIFKGTRKESKENKFKLKFGTTMKYAGGGGGGGGGTARPLKRTVLK